MTNLSTTVKSLCYVIVKVPVRLSLSGISDGARLFSEQVNRGHLLGNRSVGYNTSCCEY